jgi:hypothetical protein
MGDDLQRSGISDTGPQTLSTYSAVEGVTRRTLDGSTDACNVNALPSQWQPKQTVTRIRSRRGGRPSPAFPAAGMSPYKDGRRASSAKRSPNSLPAREFGGGAGLSKLGTRMAVRAGAVLPFQAPPKK